MENESAPGGGGKKTTRFELGRVPHNKGSGAVSNRLENESGVVRQQTADHYQRAWEAYRRDPTSRAVCGALKCGPVQAKRLIHQGLPALGLPGLEARLKEENRLAMGLERRVEVGGEKMDAAKAARIAEERRAAAAAALTKERAVLGDAAAQHEAEMRLVRANRNTALALSGVMGELLHSGLALSKRLRKWAEDDGQKLAPRDVVAALKSVAMVAKQTAEVSEASVRMERLLAGEPTAVLGLKGIDGGGGKEMSQEEAEKWLELAARMYERGRERSRREAEGASARPVEPVVEGLLVAGEGPARPAEDSGVPQEGVGAPGASQGA